MAKKRRAGIGGISADEIADLQSDFWSKSKREGFWRELKLFLKRQNPFPKERDITVPGGMDPARASKILEIIHGGGSLKAAIALLEREELIQGWQRFYKEVFGFSSDKLDLSDLEIPENPSGFNWLLIMFQGLTADQLYKKCKSRFGAWKYYNDLKGVTSVRKTDHTYAIRLLDRIEADEENKNKSANKCDEEGINGITLEERFLLELWYHWRTGEHLDIDNWTLCSGSRDADGNVPYVYWHSGDGEMSVGRYPPGYSDDYLRSRSVVSS